MNKILLSTLLFASVISTLKAQIYTPSATIQGNSGSNNVGVGTTAPNAKLEIYNTAQAGHLLLSANDNPNADATRIDIDFRVANHGHTVGRIASFYSTSEYGGSGGLRFFTRSGGSLVEKMRIISNGNVGIGTANPGGKLEISGNSAIYSDFASYSGITINNYLPNGKEPTLIINENIAGTYTPGVGGQITYRGGLSFGRGGPGIYSVNPNPAGSGFYGEIRFHTTYWNGSDYSNADRMVIKLDGNVGIGTTNPTSKLTVAGDINSREVKVTVNAGADFVFAEDYALPSLDSVDRYIKENKHLPEIASADEMKKDGINLSEMNIKLLQKVEELTLYTIHQEKKLQKQNEEAEKINRTLEIYNKALQNQQKLIGSLTERLNRLEKK